MEIIPFWALQPFKTLSTEQNATIGLAIDRIKLKARFYTTGHDQIIDYKFTFHNSQCERFVWLCGTVDWVQTPRLAKEISSLLDLFVANNKESQISIDRVRRRINWAAAKVNS
jgi:hypothetical protein